MTCFTLATVENLLIWLVVVIGVVTLIRIFLPWVMTQLGPPATASAAVVVQIVNVVLWVVVTIVIIVVVFDLLSCLLVGGHLLR